MLHVVKKYCLSIRQSLCNCSRRIFMRCRSQFFYLIFGALGSTEKKSNSCHNFDAKFSVSCRVFCEGTGKICIAMYIFPDTTYTLVFQVCKKHFPAWSVKWWRNSGATSIKVKSIVLQVVRIFFIIGDYIKYINRVIITQAAFFLYKFLLWKRSSILICCKSHDLHGM